MHSVSGVHLHLNRRSQMQHRMSWEPPRAEDPDPAPDLLAAAVKAFPDAHSKVPSLRAIQRQMGIGQAKAQQVQHAIKSARVLLGSAHA